MKAQTHPRHGVTTSVGRLARTVTAVSRGLNVVAAVLVGVLILLGVWDVASREFGLPYIAAGSDLAALVLTSIAFLAWPAVEAENAHVASTVVVDRLPRRMSQWIVTAGQVIALATAAWLAWASLGRADHAREINEHTIGSDPIAVWPVRYLLAMVTVILVAQMLVTIGRMVTSRDGFSTRPSEGDSL